ncbi:MAG: hypothetical protein LKJ83_00825 [Eubacteriaceae bacterium]|jgi:hypothetical protein|nr:hypothetical protein [Eubacteriaceae bacterium]
MNFSTAAKYQFHDGKKSLIVFGIVMASLLVIFLILALIAMVWVDAPGSVVDLGTATDVNIWQYMQFLEVTSGFFLAVFGMCSYKENFLMMTQNGVSRKTIFLSRGAVFAEVAALVFAGCAAFYYLTMVVLKIITSIIGEKYIFSLAFWQPGTNPITSSIEVIIVFITVMFVGYFITVLFYRMNKAGKIAVPIALLILLNTVPLVDNMLNSGRILMTAENIISWAASTPINGIIFDLIIIAVFGCASWLIMRKAPVKRVN